MNKIKYRPKASLCGKKAATVSLTGLPMASMTLFVPFKYFSSINFV